MRVLAWLAPLLLARGAHGAPPAWLTWEAPPACAQAEAVERRVDELLAGNSPAAAGLRVSGVVRRDGDAWVLRLVARQGAGVQRRRLRHPDCALLGEAAALLVAMAVDPAAVTIEPRLAGLLRRSPRPAVTPSERAPEPGVSAAIEAPAQPPRTQEEPRPLAIVPEPPPGIIVPEPPPVQAPRSIAGGPEPPPVQAPRSIAGVPAPGAAPSVPPAASRPAPLVPPTITRPPGARTPPRPALATPPPIRAPVALAILVRLGGGVAIGATPRVAGGVSGAIGLGLGPRARLELPVFYSAPTRARLEAAPDSGAAVSLVSAGLRGCGVPGRGVVDVPLCLGVELGSMRATGFGVDDGRSPRSLWAALTPGLAVLLSPRSWLALGIWLDVPFALVRPRFEVGGGGEVWHAAAAGLRTALGAEVRIPARRGRRR